MRCFRSCLIVLCAIAGLITSPAALRAQFPTDIQAGSRVRVWLPEPYPQVEGPVRRQLLRGSVESVAPDTLRLSVPGTFGVLSIPRGSVRRLEVSHGVSRPASALERAVTGAIGGAIFYALMNDPKRSGGPHYRTDWRAAGVGAAWGAGIGATVGFVFPHERWHRVRMPR